MSELGLPEVPAVIKGSCFSMGYVFGPGTELTRMSDAKEFKLVGVFSNWDMDGEINYLCLSSDLEQCWVRELDLMEGSKEFLISKEVLAEHVSAEREKSLHG